MTREQALGECERRSVEDPGSVWAPQQLSAGRWTVVRARVPGLATRPALRSAVQPPPMPPRPDAEVPPQPRWLPYGIQ